MLAPFGLLLAAMALGPSLFRKQWEKHYPKIAFGLGAITVAYYVLGLGALPRVLDISREYFSFIVLIGSLFVVSGGIHIHVKGEATPRINTLFLLAGALAANLLGTTGASMLLIRPWIRLNKYRVTNHHIVFFIFVVANVGGCLTPVGDPPLFLGYLQGVPFWWVARHCWPMWCVGVGFLLGLFYILDRANYRKAPQSVRADQMQPAEQWRFEGMGNLLYLLAILVAVFVHHPVFVREGIMLVAAIASFYTTPKRIHVSNHFDMHPIREVAVLFVGIFATMLPALDLLEAHPGKFAESGTSFFFWGSGLLSSVLDNAPTYLSFLSALLGAFGAGGAAPSPAALAGHEAFAMRLLALSIGAVFFGANTYIGNGPNFMVKAIADRQHVRTPGFLGFFFRYTVPCMGPMLVLVWVLFFRKL